MWRRFGADQIFWDRYAQTNVIEDIATILGEVVANPVSSRTRLLSSTALRGKFDTIRELIGGLFASASKADVFTLLEREETPDAWAQPDRHSRRRCGTESRSHCPDGREESDQ